MRWWLVTVGNFPCYVIIISSHWKNHKWCICVHMSEIISLQSSSGECIFIYTKLISPCYWLPSFSTPIKVFALSMLLYSLFLLSLSIQLSILHVFCYTYLIIYSYYIMCLLHTIFSMLCTENSKFHVLKFMWKWDSTLMLPVLLLLSYILVP